MLPVKLKEVVPDKDIDEDIVLLGEVEAVEIRVDEAEMVAVLETDEETEIVSVLDSVVTTD